MRILLLTICLLASSGCASLLSSALGEAETKIAAPVRQKYNIQPDDPGITQVSKVVAVELKTALAKLNASRQNEAELKAKIKAAEVMAASATSDAERRQLEAVVAELRIDVRREKEAQGTIASDTTKQIGGGLGAVIIALLIGFIRKSMKDGKSLTEGSNWKEFGIQMMGAVHRTSNGGGGAGDAVLREVMPMLSTMMPEAKAMVSAEARARGLHVTSTPPT